MKQPDNKYGLIVIGGGITGLSAALAWCKTMRKKEGKVLVLEKNNVLGGCVNTFARKGYRFDTVQLIPESSDLFEYFGLKMELVKFEGYFARIFLIENPAGKATEIRIPSGITEFKEMLKARYTEDSVQIEEFFQTSQKMYGELKHLKLNPSIFQLIQILIKCPTIVKYANYTFEGFMDQFGFESPELKEIFNVFCAFSGMSAQRCAALLTVSAMLASLKGSYRPKNGFINLPYAFKKEIEKFHGEIKTRKEVKRIIIEDGKAKGVELVDGEKIFADKVVTTADTKWAIQQLIGYGTLNKLDKKYAKKAEKVKMSVSAMTISLGLDDDIDLEGLGLKCGYNVLTTGKGTFENLFKAHDMNKMGHTPTNFHCAVICPSIITGRKPVIIIRVVPMPLSDWDELRLSDPEGYKRRKDEVAGFFINEVDKYMIPGLKDHIRYCDISSPATYKRYLGSPTGSNYDMAPYPDNFGRKRLPMKTPVKNLYQPKFSHGIWPSMQAGLQVIDMISKGKIMKGASRYTAPKANT